MRQESDGGPAGAADDVIGHGYRSAADRAAGEQDGVTTLIAGVIRDLQEIVRGEIKLAKTELREDATAAFRAIAAMVAGALVGLVGFIFLMLGATYLLNKWVEMWIAAGIVGLGLAAIAAFVTLNGKNRLSGVGIAPDQTIDSLKEDQEWARQQINSVRR